MTWLPLASFCETECETPDVRLLVDGVEILGFWDDDDRCWRSAADDEEAKPMSWKPL